MIVVSANYAGYDAFKPPPPGADRCVMFTDRPMEAAALGWNVVSNANPSVPPRLRSKPPKCAPHLLLVDADGDVVWIDASLRATGRDMRDLVALVPPGGVGTFRHRFRRTIQEEAEASHWLDRYRGEPVREQAAFYGDVLGLYETGCIVWRGAQHHVGVRWLAECLAWSSQDQIGFPYVLHEHREDVTILPGTSVDNEWFKWEQHERIDWA